MEREYWATMSIYDHEAPYFRASLILFDKVVLPIPIVPFGRIGEAELDRLRADGDFLRDRGCAVTQAWNPLRFQEWAQDALAAANAMGLRSDRELLTRYQLLGYVMDGSLEEVTIPRGVVAMPVYGSIDTYLAQVPATFEAARQMTVDLIIDGLPVAAPDTPLEDIVRLRDAGFLQHQVRALRQWQLELIEDLMALGGDAKRLEARLERAGNELELAKRDYESAIQGILRDTTTSRLTTMFSAIRNPLVALERLATAQRHELVDVHEHSWRDLYDKPFAFAGVVWTLAQFTARSPAS
jgi:hypothetical protein